VNLPEPRQVPAGAGVGERLPDFRITCVDGGEFTLSQHRGEVVVINLWATWCTPCVKELPHFDRLQRENPGRVAVLALHVPPVTTDVAEYLSAFSYEIPFAVDEDGGVSTLLNESEPYKLAVVRLQASPQAIERLGAPITAGSAGGSIKTDDGKGGDAPKTADTMTVVMFAGIALLALGAVVVTKKARA
jgi:LPXTG-motif cell wall-anchored protein